MIDWFKQECARRGLGVMQTLDQLARENDAYLAGWQESRSDVPTGHKDYLSDAPAHLSQEGASGWLAGWNAAIDATGARMKQAVMVLRVADTEQAIEILSADTHPHDEEREAVWVVRCGSLYQGFQCDRTEGHSGFHTWGMGLPKDERRWMGEPDGSRYSATPDRGREFCEDCATLLMPDGTGHQAYCGRHPSRVNPSTSSGGVQE